MGQNEDNIKKLGVFNKSLSDSGILSFEFPDKKLGPEVTTAEKITKIQGNWITLQSDVCDGEVIDTRVYLGQEHARIYICTIAGTTIDEFLKDLNSLIIKFRI